MQVQVLHTRAQRLVKANQTVGWGFAVDHFYLLLSCKVTLRYRFHVLQQVYVFWLELVAVFDVGGWTDQKVFLGVFA